MQRQWHRKEQTNPSCLDSCGIAPENWETARDVRVTVVGDVQLMMTGIMHLRKTNKESTGTGTPVPGLFDLASFGGPFSAFLGILFEDFKGYMVRLRYA